MRELEYYSKTITTFHVVEEERLVVQSEKLVIGFGLTATESNIRIEIIKNHWVCLNSHTTTRFIYKKLQLLLLGMLKDATISKIDYVLVGTIHEAK